MGTTSGSGRAQAKNKTATKSKALRDHSTDRLGLHIGTSQEGARNGRRRRALHVSVAFLLALPASGCGASASAPSSDAAAPKAGDSMEVSSGLHISDAEAELTLAEQTLEQIFSPAAQPQPLGPSTSPSSQPAPPPSSTPLDAGASRCELACKALGSMRRSSAYVCRLAGPDDPRCELARARVVKAEGRVSGAGCRCEAAPG